MTYTIVITLILLLVAFFSVGAGGRAKSVEKARAISTPTLPAVAPKAADPPADRTPEVKSSEGGGNREHLSSAKGASTPDPEADRTPEVNYWHRLAVKRLKLLGKRERRIVALMAALRRHRTHHHRSFYDYIEHRAGWLCIHSREGAWNANTGNGYYGGLQMHLDWYGVHRADLLSAEQQMAAAERAYRQSGYSSSWLAGQWPNTYPPCSGLF